MDWLKFFLRLSDGYRRFNPEELRVARDSAIKNWPQDEWYIHSAFVSTVKLTAAQKVSDSIAEIFSATRKPACSPRTPPGASAPGTPAARPAPAGRCPGPP